MLAFKQHPLARKWVVTLCPAIFGIFSRNSLAPSNRGQNTGSGGMSRLILGIKTRPSILRKSKPAHAQGRHCFWLQLLCGRLHRHGRPAERRRGPFAWGPGVSSVEAQVRATCWRDGWNRSKTKPYDTALPIGHCDAMVQCTGSNIVMVWLKSFAYPWTSSFHESVSWSQSDTMR